ncbi:MAG: DUF72 domain-containing protein [Leptolyngbyaceae cyanobacterium bins.302]|nr:DUF72 domain-containing protein [Leptolyngbyaceae cyanobacterium bins.302]
MGALTQNFWIGCALWGYKPWVGSFFPPESRSIHFLALYSERFTAVEGNTTFYSVPDAPTIARWVRDTPSGFRFCPKFPKAVTHKGLLQPQIAEAMQFIERMQGLGDRLGPLFIQLPPRYSPAAWDDLSQFLTQLSHMGVEIALEVRHLDWFESVQGDRLNALLSSLQVGRVLLDTRPIYETPNDPQLEVERKKPKVPAVFDIMAPFSLIRYISHPTWAMNQRFLQDWSKVVAQGLQDGKRIYFFVHCPVEERSPANARSIQQMFEQQGLALPALPWNHIEPPSTQLNLL